MSYLGTEQTEGMNSLHRASGAGPCPRPLHNPVLNYYYLKQSDLNPQTSASFCIQHTGQWIQKMVKQKLRPGVFSLSYFKVI